MNKPEFYETMYFGDSYNFGSLAMGGRGDTSGFRLTTYDSTDGASILLVAPADQATPHGGRLDRIGQYDNIAVLLAPAQMTKKNKKPSNRPWCRMWCTSPFLKVTTLRPLKSRLSFRLKTWIAIVPVNGNAMTGKHKTGKKGKLKKTFLSSESSVSEGVFGYAVEVDAHQPWRFRSLQGRRQHKAKIAIDGTTVTYTATDGRTLAVTRKTAW